MADIANAVVLTDSEIHGIVDGEDDVWENYYEIARAVHRNYGSG